MSFCSCYSLVFLLGLIQPALQLPLSSFYPYGLAVGDKRVSTNDDGSSGKIPISVPFPFFDKFHDSLFVNTNGVVSFLRQVSQFTPDPFPLGNQRRLVAPFWADVDTRNGGVVWYRETNTANLLSRATNDIRKVFVNQPRFHATWGFIATWDNVAFYGATNAMRRRKRNTFQAVIITNGRHSFVIFNYNKIVWTTGTASGGNSNGLGGTPAQAGFNAGDGKSSSSIPGSRTSAILNLPATSNVAIPGRWMFRTDNARIKVGGCNVEGSLAVYPSRGTMLGGLNVVVSGPCYDKSRSKLVCTFGFGSAASGVVINAIHGVCTVPMMKTTGPIFLVVSTDGGRRRSFIGTFNSLPITREAPRVIPQYNAGGSMTEGQPVKITWDHQNLGSKSARVTVEMARYVMNGGKVQFHSLYTLVANQNNSGTSEFIVARGEGVGPVGRRYITIIRVRKLDKLTDKHSSYQWIWSDVFLWNGSRLANTNCLNWFNRQPSPTTITNDASFLSCPRTRRQALVDRGRFTADEFCNPRNVEGCRRYHPTAESCFRSVNPNNKGAGTQCCYSNQGNLLFGPPGGGSLDHVHVKSGIPVLSHFFADLVPYYDCCSWSSNCDKYYAKRPSDNGASYVPPRPATGFGDPHIITLDGVEYTFNGYGEYTLLKVNTTKFVLQGRMQPLTDDRGRSSRATVYTAFAVRENNSDVVQIALNGRQYVDVFVNGNLTEFEEQRLEEYEGVSIEKQENTSKYWIVFNSGISITVEGKGNLLEIMLVVPENFKGMTSGLLGYWDDDRSKEFLLPNGRFLSTDSNMRALHFQFGQKWAITAEESLFTYERGKSHASYVNSRYTPVFLDSNHVVFTNRAVELQARRVCGNDKRCLFDIKTTGSIDVGKSSLIVSQEFEIVVNDTETKACIPISSVLVNGVTRRVDTENGMVYYFNCNDGFNIIGPRVIACTGGTYNNTNPTTCSKIPTTRPPPKSCSAAGMWKNFPRMDQWCQNNCAIYTELERPCPPSRCVCV